MRTAARATVILFLLVNFFNTAKPYRCIDLCRAKYKQMKWNKLSNCVHNLCAYKKRGFQSPSDRLITDSTMQSNPDNNCILDTMWNDLSKSSQEFILKVFDSELDLHKLSKE
ncbi:uncharacterized protein LOC117120852 [Anneissia japonica]|uniref:uncharacterized protein LOC117120852 n=1 Tax=Anneissia japonica TaxID=1529436 RepID=UPI0014256F41|nr:uncharacterized protein LOC117120852 [Anneissia japonica]